MITADMWPDAEMILSDVLEMLLGHPMKNPVNGMHAEILGAQYVLENPAKTLIVSKSRKFNWRYMVAESLWNIAPRSDVKFLRRYFNGVDAFVADQPMTTRSNATWAYGPYLNFQFHAMLKELREIPSSRRASATTRVFHTKGMPLAGTPPCLTSVQWLVRDDVLTQVTTMRSNDAWLGLPLDILQFSMWQRMAAAALGFKCGPYIHQAGSLHLYQRDVEAANAFLNVDRAAHAAPAFGQTAMLEALQDVPATLVERYGHKRYGDDDILNEDFYVHNAPGLKEYVALLLGDYHNIGENLSMLQSSGLGVGF